MEPTQFGRFLKKIRKDMGLKLKELAELSNISQGYLSQIESGMRGKKPSPEILKKLAPALNITYEELLVEAGYVEEAINLLSGNDFKTNYLPFTAHAYINILLKPNSKVEFFDFLIPDIEKIKRSIIVNFGITFPEEQPISMTLKKIIEPKESYDDIAFQGQIVEYITNELGKLVYKSRKYIYSLDKKNNDLIEILGYPNISINGKFLSAKEIKQVSIILDALFLEE